MMYIKHLTQDEPLVNEKGTQSYEEREQES